jgi:hypothetical protein
MLIGYKCPTHGDVRADNGPCCEAAQRQEYEHIDHPPHYNQHPSGVEAIDIIEHMTHNVGAAMKYLWRAGYKPGNTAIQDLKKSAWYIAREIQRLEKIK